MQSSSRATELIETLLSGLRARFYTDLFRAAPNRCKKLSTRRIFARRPGGRLASRLRTAARALRGHLYSAQRACRSSRRRAEPRCNLCDSR